MNVEQVLRVEDRTLTDVPDLPALMLAATLSRLAGRMFSLTLVIYGLVRLSSPALAGWLTFAAMAPGLAASPVAGTILDRCGPTTAVKADLAASALFTRAERERLVVEIAAASSPAPASHA